MGRKFGIDAKEIYDSLSLPPRIVEKNEIMQIAELDKYNLCSVNYHNVCVSSLALLLKGVKMHDELV